MCGSCYGSAYHQFYLERANIGNGRFVQSFFRELTLRFLKKKQARIFFVAILVILVKVPKLFCHFNRRHFIFVGIVDIIVRCATFVLKHWRNHD